MGLGGAGAFQLSVIPTWGRSSIPLKKGNLRGLALGQTPEAWRGWLPLERWDRWEQCWVHVLGVAAHGDVPISLFQMGSVLVSSLLQLCGDTASVLMGTAGVFPWFEGDLPFLRPLRKSHISHQLTKQEQE